MGWICIDENLPLIEINILGSPDFGTFDALLSKLNNPMNKNKNKNKNPLIIIKF